MFSIPYWCLGQSTVMIVELRYNWELFLSGICYPGFKLKPYNPEYISMLLVDPEKKLSFTRCIGDGDLVIVYEKHDTMKAVKVSESSVLQNRFGMFKHSDWIGKPFGSKVFSNKGGFVHLLAPTPELWTLVLSHRTQILYIADISLVVMYLEVVPGCLVLESGTGSGSLTTSLARAIAPTGHVYTFDFHEQRAASAREDFEKTGISSLVTVGVRDIQGEGFPEQHTGSADAVFLDLPQPWLAIPSAEKMLKQDAVLCSFSPCIEQVQRSCETLRSNFTDIRTFEILVRTYEVREGKLSSFEEDGSISKGCRPGKRKQPSSERSSSQEDNNTPPPPVLAKPCSETRGHTGYLTFARLKCLAS
ncbi:tRNA (adenine(58)-N(1))-methyltransferase catalytic subunit TRMT61A [Linum perenne]